MIKYIRKFIEFYLLILCGLLIRLFPLTAVQSFARMLGSFVFYCLPVRKKIVLSQLSLAFQDTKTPVEIKNIAQDTYRQFSQTFFELLYFPKLTKEAIVALTRIDNLDILNEAIQKGNGGVLVGSHFGNWELMGIALSYYHPVTFVVGEQTNKKTDVLLNKIRIDKGIKIIPLKFALRGVMKTLKQNEFLAIISDQDAHEGGAFVNFFGRPASTPKAAAQFALRMNCPIITGHCIRERGTFHIIFDLIQKPPTTGDIDLDIKNYTAAYTAKIEEYCRKYPDHWFWMHKRWKTRPPLE